MSSIKTLRLVALAEATSFLALLVAAIYFKRIEGLSAGSTAVSILGPIHGVIFLGYVFLTITLRAEQRWSNATTFYILLGAVIPFGGYYVDWWLRKNAR